MKRILKTPLLPQNKATLAISAEAENTISSLEKLGYETFKIKNNPKLDSSVSSHADCNLLQLDEKTFICDESLSADFTQYIKEKVIVNNLTIGQANTFKKDICIYNEEIASPYPGETVINVKRLENCIVCNTKYVSKIIQIYSAANNLNLYHCNQGYVGCSSVLVDENAVMTDDPTVYACFHRIGFDCLMLSKGQIKLSGQNYGFIGGCCGFIDKKLIAFNGRLDSHNDANIIKKFLKKYNIEYTEIIDDVLTDIGGIMPILEDVT